MTLPFFDLICMALYSNLCQTAQLKLLFISTSGEEGSD